MEGAREALARRARRRLRRHRHVPALRDEGVLQRRRTACAPTPDERARRPLARLLGADVRRHVQVPRVRHARGQPGRGRHPRAPGARRAGGALGAGSDRLLLLVGLFGAALLYGDGIITPGDLGARRGRGARGRGAGVSSRRGPDRRSSSSSRSSCSEARHRGASARCSGRSTLVWFVCIAVARRRAGSRRDPACCAR